MKHKLPHSPLIGSLAVAVLLIVAGGARAAMQGRQVAQPRLENPAADAQVERVLRYLGDAEYLAAHVTERECYRLSWQVVRATYYDRRSCAYEYEFRRMYGAHWLQATTPEAWERARRERLTAMRRAEWVRRKAARVQRGVA